MLSCNVACQQVMQAHLHFQSNLGPLSSCHINHLIKFLPLQLFDHHLLILFPIKNGLLEKDIVVTQMNKWTDRCVC